jgi:hypothetical protein
LDRGSTWRRIASIRDTTGSVIERVARIMLSRSVS